MNIRGHQSAPESRPASHTLNPRAVRAIIAYSHSATDGAAPRNAKARPCLNDPVTNQCHSFAQTARQRNCCNRSPCPPADRPFKLAKSTPSARSLSRMASPPAHPPIQHVKHFIIDRRQFLFRQTIISEINSRQGQQSVQRISLIAA